MENKTRKRARRLSDIVHPKIEKRLKTAENAEAKVFSKQDHFNEEQAFPLNKEGETLFMNLKPGDVANRILSVGDTGRALKISKFFDKPEYNILIESKSSKVFKVFTGTYKGVPISIVVTGMGHAMVDIIIRETRRVVEGPMAAIRLGTCGIINPKYDAGNIMVASKGSILSQTNHQELIKGNKEKGYIISKPALPDIELTNILLSNLKEVVGKDKVREILNCTGDSFYASQGRVGPSYNDMNGDLVDIIKSKYPNVSSLEMESFYLINANKGNTHTTASAIGLIQRDDPTNMLSATKLKELEDLAGLAILKTLSEYSFPEDETEYRQFMKDKLDKYELEKSKADEIKPVAIKRIMKKNPQFAAELTKIIRK